MSFLGYSSSEKRETGFPIGTVLVPGTEQLVEVAQPTVDEVARANAYLVYVQTQFGLALGLENYNDVEKIIELLNSAKKATPFSQTPVINSYTALSNALENEKKFDSRVYKYLSIMLGGHKIWFSWTKETAWVLFVA